LASESPTAQASDELSITIDLSVTDGSRHGVGEYVAQVVGPAGVVLKIVQEPPTAQPLVGEDIATPYNGVLGTGVATAVQVPQSVSIVPESPTATP